MIELPLESRVSSSFRHIWKRLFQQGFLFLFLFSFPSSIFLSSENPFFFSSHAINGQQQVKGSKSTWECVCVCTCFLVHPTLSAANKTHTHTHTSIDSQATVRIEETGWTSIWKQPALYFHEPSRLEKRHGVSIFSRARSELIPPSSPKRNLVKPQIERSMTIISSNYWHEPIEPSNGPND